MKTLWQELQKQGFTSSYASVWHFLRTWPLPEAMQLGNHPPIPLAHAKPTTRTPRQTMWVLLQPPETLSEVDATYRAALFRLAPALATLSALGQDCVQMIRQRQSSALLPWLERARTCGFPEMQRFALDLSNVNFVPISASVLSKTRSLAPKR